MRLYFGFTIAALSFSAGLAAQIDIYDNSINVRDTITWRADNSYLLKGRVFAESTSVLRIEPGTVIRGVDVSGEACAALIICRGAKIFAEGTKDRPIIFTAQMDDLKAPGQGVMFPNMAKLWGGIVICGRAPSSNIMAGASTEPYFEAFKSSESRAFFGGNDPNDNSGIFKYVSIRYGGIEIEQDKEINALTLCGVGRGTELHHVEVYNTGDDGFEWFGGCVNTKYLVVSGVGDDGFDYDQGYYGVNQFWYGFWAGDRGIEASSKGTAAGRHSEPIIANGTFYGAGDGAGGGTGTPSDILYFDTNAGGHFLNCYFACDKNVIDRIYWDATGNARFTAGGIEIRQSALMLFNETRNWGPIKNSYCIAGTMSGCPALLAGGCWQWDFKLPFVKSADARANTRKIEPRPADTVFAINDLYPLTSAKRDSGGFLQHVCYKGAFDPAKDTLWLQGWTALDQFGYLSSGKATIPSIPNCNPSMAGDRAGARAPANRGGDRWQVRDGLLRITLAEAHQPAALATLLSMRGEAIARVPAMPRTCIGIPVAGLAAGNYICRIRTNAGTNNLIVPLVR